MNDIIGYKCKHCNKPKGEHKAVDLNCKSSQRGAFAGFLETKYEPDETKPIYGLKL